MSEPESNEPGLYRRLRPLLFALPPELAHKAAIVALRFGAWAVRPVADDPRLAIDIWGRRFANPIGLAAGFDKDALAWSGASRLGFGFLEIGTITPEPQPGNPRPRLFRLPANEAIVNRLGFNSAGMEAAAKALAGRHDRQVCLGINIGKNKDSADAIADYAAGAGRLARFADYLVVNVSSPNTPGLRQLQNRQTIATLSERARAAMASAGAKVPLLLKIAPDMTPEDLKEIAEVARTGAYDGLIVSNTTIARPVGLDPVLASEPGGLSGRPLFELSTRILREMYALTEGAVPLVGVGGIASGQDAYAKIRAGASLVQLYTALVYRGPGLVRQIKRDLVLALEKDGYDTLQAAIGRDHHAR